MKSQIIKLVALIALLTGGFSSCTEKEELGGDVPYKPCPCEKEMPLWEIQQFPRGEAYLFKDSIPIQMVNKINTEMYLDPFPKICWIVYDSEIDDACINIGNLFYPDGGSISSIGSICNFPDFAKEWIIPENGCKVNLEGIMYEPCNIDGTANVVRINYVLTSLKRK